MNNRDLNKIHKNKMKGTCSEAVHFEWQDGDILNILLGDLPKIHREDLSNKALDKLLKLEKRYQAYNAFSTNIEKFLSDIVELVHEIKLDIPHWYGLNLESVRDAIGIHKSCLISGEGGIGKSYFIKCFEQELEKRKINHLCIYGKFLKDINDIDFDEIVEVGETEGYIFVFDAINEISDDSQLVLLDNIKKIINIPGVRVVLTYRNHTVNEYILNQFQSITNSQYEFPGVSFESALEWMSKIPIIDISEYIDILYTNNPSLLCKLKVILQSEDLSESFSKNNVSRYTYIYEQYVKRSLDLEMWEKTKIISKWMYSNNSKSISASQLEAIISNHDEYIAKMEQMGFLTHYSLKDQTYCSFVIDTLADYLIARNMWNELKDLDLEACVAIIKEKLEAFYGIHEMLILVLFDKFSPDYAKIYDILKETRLIEHLDQETLVKVHFRPENIPAFREVFIPNSHEESLLYFAGYVNKPFNCTNYLNRYYLGNEEKQIKELTNILARKHLNGTLQSRLKNALYCVCKCECTENRCVETFYTALWCSSAGNSNIRRLATKLLFEVLQRSDYLVDVAISVFPKIKDYYILDSLIYAMSMCSHDERIVNFLNTIWNRPDFIMSKSICRISEYLGQPYKYIHLAKDNLFDPNASCPSETFVNFLGYIDLMEKDLLPFRFWGVNRFQSEVKFLAIDRKTIKDFNDRVTTEFACVRLGECNGMLSFQKKAEEYCGVSFADYPLNGDSFLASLEKVFREIFKMYALPFDTDAYLKQGERYFGASIFKKCICIAIDIFYGSLMCNYYSLEFGTYNNHQDCIGYEVYNPLEYGDELKIKSPVSIYQPDVEKMGALVLSKLNSSDTKDEKWWSNLKHTQENVLSLLSPISFGGYEWIMIAGRISIQDDLEIHTWKETYTWYCCTSFEETLNNDGKERYLTIELENYDGNIEEYASYPKKPWLCKTVPTIAYSSDIFEDTGLVLPPAQIIQTLNLKVKLDEMSWLNVNGERVIICNNNRLSYFRDPIMGTVFIRRDIFEQLQEMGTIKFFAFSEKYLKPKGYCDDSAYHFEVSGGCITKAVPNYQSGEVELGEKTPGCCKNCQYGFYKPLKWDETSKLAQYLKLYSTQTENDILWDAEDDAL